MQESIIVIQVNDGGLEKGSGSRCGFGVCFGAKINGSILWVGLDPRSQRNKWKLH